MEKSKEIDFRASGVALDSSAAIYLMKAKLLLKLEDPPLPPRRTSDYIPPPLIYPLRYELTSTTIDHFMKALGDALKTERQLPPRSLVKPILPSLAEIIPVIDKYIIEIENRMKEVRLRLRQLAEKNEIINYSTIIKEIDEIDAIITFMVLLFLAQNGEISLQQEEIDDEIVGEIKIRKRKSPL